MSYTGRRSDWVNLPSQTTPIFSADLLRYEAGTAAALNPAWQPSTVYYAGQLVTNGGSLYAANADHTSGASFTAGNWTQVGGGVAGADNVTTVASSGATQTLTLPTSNLGTWDVTLTANCTLTFAGATSGKGATITLLARQDSTGSRTVTWPATVAWAAGTAPALSTTGNQVDVFSFLSVDGGASWIGAVVASGVQLPAVPGAPTSVNATGGNANTTITWVAPAFPSPAITNYKVYRGTTAGGETLLTTVGNVTTYNDTGLTNGTTYYYKVSAVNASGEGALSAETSATPAAPTGLPNFQRTVTDGVLNSSTTITSATANFTSADVGRAVLATGVPTYAQIASVTNSTTAVLNYAATASTSGTTIKIGSVPAQWFKADAITGLADGAAVSTWNDSSATPANAIVGTSGVAPIYKTGIIGGLPVVRFNGTTQWLTSSAVWTDRWTALIVAKQGATGGSYALIGGGPNPSAAGGVTIQIPTTNKLEIVKSRVSVTFDSTATVPSAAFSVLGASASDVNVGAGTQTYKTTVNGTKDLTTTPTTWTTGGYIVLGNDSTNGASNPFNGDIAEVIVYPQGLPDADRRAVESYLGGKYGITVV